MHGIGDAIGAAIAALIGLCIIFVPLGMWKLIEVIIWLWANVHFGAAP
jgi:uncharacterized membrane protein